MTFKVNSAVSATPLLISVAMTSVVQTATGVVTAVFMCRTEVPVGTRVLGSKLAEASGGRSTTVKVQVLANPKSAVRFTSRLPELPA